MAILYNKRENSQRIIEPLFQINRIKYRNSRISHMENLETNLFKLDISRINQQLSNIEDKISINLSYFIEKPSNQTNATKLEDGISTQIDNVDYHLELTDLQYVLELDVTNKLSGKLSRLLNKIQRLESGI